MVQLVVRLSDSLGEWGLVELQGQLETRDGAPFDGMHLGDLHFDDKGTPLLIIGHHLLTGKVVELDKPLAVLVKSRDASEVADGLGSTVDKKGSGGNCGRTEYEIKALVKRKIIFKNRPKPIITSTLTIKNPPVMCDRGREGLQAEPELKRSFSVGRRCMKCEKAAVTTARTKDPFCKECFNAYFIHRFRATFGKVRLFTEGEKVLLAFSGGMNSRVLLGLAEEGLNLSVYKKLRFEPTVVVVDEGAVVGETWSNRCCQLSQCLSIATATGFQTVYTRIEQVFAEDCVVCNVDRLLKERGSVKKKGEGGSEPISDSAASISSAKGSDEENGSDPTSPELEEALYQSLLEDSVADEVLVKRVRSLFDSATSLTAKESLLLSLRRKLLVEIARKLGYSKVLMGDTATRLAVRLMGNVAQGKGGTLPLDTGFIDDRVGDVALIRPLREFPANEVAMYASLNSLCSVFIPQLTTLEPEQASIEKLTESFIVGLQVDFPSTTSTVFRTGDKLTVAVDERSTRCALCQAPVGPPADTSVFAHLSLTGQCEPGLWNSLCYGCQLTFKDMKHISSVLPPFVDHSRRHVDTSREPPSCIKDCLIEETNT